MLSNLQIYFISVAAPLVEADKETDEKNYLLWRLEKGVAEGSTEILKGISSFPPLVYIWFPSKLQGNLFCKVEFHFSRLVFLFCSRNIEYDTEFHMNKKVFIPTSISSLSIRIIIVRTP